VELNYQEAGERKLLIRTSDLRLARVAETGQLLLEMPQPIRAANLQSTICNLGMKASILWDAALPMC
jgi:hypothetical protein